MLRLMYAEMKRFLQSGYYLGIALAFFAIHIIGLEGGVPFVYWGNAFLENVGLLCILLSLFLPLYLSGEFSNRTIQNKVSLGYGKAQIYIAEVMACSIGGASLVFLDSLFYFASALLRRQEMRDSPGYVAANIFIFMMAIAAVSALVSGVGLLLKTRVVAQVMLMVIAICLINSGRQSISILTDSESFFVESREEDDPASQDLIDSFKDRKLSDAARAELNREITLSPYAQCNFATYIPVEKAEDKAKHSMLFPGCPYHIDFAIVDMLFVGIAIFAGAPIFQRQDL